MKIFVLIATDSFRIYKVMAKLKTRVTVLKSAKKTVSKETEIL